MSDRLLILWIALLGATRVDFLAGSGPFLLTPFLALSPVIVVAELWRTAGAGWQPRIPPRTAGFLLAISALLALLLASTFFAYDLGTSARRFALLLAQVYLVFLVALALANRADPARILIRGSLWGLALCVVFSTVQFATFFAPALTELTAGFVDLEARRYFGIIPRLTGASHDANLGGFLILFYMIVLWLLAAPSRIRTWGLTVGALLVLLTLSRSAVLAGLVFWVVWHWRSRELRVGLPLTGAVAAVVGAVTALALFSPGTLDPMLALAEILGQRLSPDEGSTQEHLLVLGRGWEVGTESVKHVFLGLGYGNAYVALQDVYPGFEYGNFHSLFVTVFAESGTPAALLLVWVFVRAYQHGGIYRPLVAALLVFNLFQQAHAEPWMWLILMMAWTGIAEEAAEAAGPEEEPEEEAGWRTRAAPAAAAPGGTA